MNRIVFIVLIIANAVLTFCFFSQNRLLQDTLAREKKWRQMYAEASIECRMPAQKDIMVEEDDGSV